MPIVNKDAVCCFHLQGKCKYNPCRFKHIDDGSGCVYGKHCKVKHPLPRNAVQTQLRGSEPSRQDPRPLPPPLPFPRSTARPPVATASPSPSPNQGGNHQPSKLPPHLATCPVCLEQAALVQVGRCTHKPSICTDCLRQYIMTELDEGMNNIRCPHHGCTVQLEVETTIRQYATKGAFEALNLRLTRQLLGKELTHIHCSFSGCGASFDILDGERNPIVRCPKCRRLTCFTCKGPHHPGETCSERRPTGAAHAEAERRTAEFMRHYTRCCPKCGEGPCVKEETGQCDIATCPSCAPLFKFCWECGADYFKILKDSCKQHKPGCKHYA